MDANASVGIAAAALGGAAIGIERQWSGHAAGPQARFAGIRTFTLLGLLAGTAGGLSAAGWATAAAVLLGAGALLVVAAYGAAAAKDVDGTTEVAALVVLAAGFMAGIGLGALASAIIAITVLLLVEKSRLHDLVARLDSAQMRAGARFAVMAIVILPLLPDGPFGPLGGVRPRELWALVLFFSGLSFAGYTARRAMGPQQGWAVAGLLGGILSSTAVALGFSRTSRTDPALGPSLAAGVVGASTVMLPRMLLAAGVLHPPLGVALLPFLGPPLVVGIAASWLLLHRPSAAGEAPDTPTNPLQLGAALQMVVLFQIVLFLVHAVRGRFGAAGLVTTGAVLGLTDVDALTVSMVRNAATGVPLDVAARAMTAGALANTCLKLGIVAGIGRGRFRPLAAAALAALALATAVTLALV